MLGIYALSQSNKTKVPAKKTKQTSKYSHPEASALLRPEVGAQAQFKKKKKPATYRYDSSLSPDLNWDGQNPAREEGEALIEAILKAEFEDSVWAHLSGALSTPFEVGDQGRIAVKVIDDRGNEL